MVEDRHVQAGEKPGTEEAEEEGQREGEAPSLCTVHLKWALMLGGDEACLGFQPCSLHSPSPLGARTMAAVSCGCVCCISLSDSTQSSASEQALPPEGETLMGRVCGKTTQPSSEPELEHNCNFILLLPAQVHLSWQIQICSILISFVSF